MPFYFSYGSNMNPAQMLAHCPSAILLGPAQLLNHRLDFTLFSQTRQCGCPDIIPTPHSSVWGALYELSDPDLLLLDTYEGVPRQKYHRIEVTVWRGACPPAPHLMPSSADCGITVLDPSLTPVKTFTYAVLHKSPEFQKPSRVFLTQLIASATQLSLPVTYIEFLKTTPTCD